MPCTTILVGKKASYDGSTMIARNDDSGAGHYTSKKRGECVGQTIQDSPWEVSVESVIGYEFVRDMQIKKTKIFPPSREAIPIVGWIKYMGETASIDEGIDEDSERRAKELLVKLAEYKPLAKIEELEEQNYNMIDERINNGVEKFNREEEKKEKQEKPEARFFLKGRLAAKQKEAAQGKNKDMKDQEKSKNTHREI